MKQSYSTKQRLLASFMSLVMCFSMFAGTTLAWFTDTATVGIQNVVTGTLDVDIVDENDNTLTERALNFKKAAGHENDELLWEPGVTYELEDFYILNKGNLALKYKLYISGAVGDSTLLDALEFTVKIDGLETSLETFEGHLTARGTATDKSGLVKVSVHMDEEAGNEYQGLKLEGIAITVSAAQDAVEYDSYGNDYDENAIYSVINYPVNVKYDIPAEKVGPDNQLIEEILIPAANGIYAKLPVGTQLEDGADKLHFTITYLDPESNNITVDDGKNEIPVDVHIDGVSDENTQPIEIGLGNMMSTGLNMGNYNLKHVENDVPVDMTENDSLNAHNNFTYNPATGDVTIAIATFSEVTAVADAHAQWKGGFDYSWYTNAVPTADADYIIANADQLAGFSAIVGGMNGQAQNSFTGKTVKLISDINLGDAEADNDSTKIFYPIGYYNSTRSYEKVSGGSVTSDINSFEGTFDGNGHTISNFYQNTWEMFGDYNSGYTGTPNHYKDGMGLFGYVVNGTVKNLTVENFSSDGEFTPTGVIAAYAVNSTFENIALTNCNPRVYNTGNGGIVGIGGNDSDPDAYNLTFTNITIDNTNKISALWGSYDVACGGLVGMFRGEGHVNMTNCHVAAQLDVFNDVCGNYQYYWYRYSGMLVGTNKNMTEKDGYTVPETDKFYAKDCTVHFGNWNDYYYCELVDNSLASYTHDHQFSRLDQVDSVDVVNKTVTIGNVTTAIPTSGRANYVVVSGEASTENATCYHFLNSEEWDHVDAGTETVNGVEGVLKEDKQHVYLPFNQLFTGYGWGVKHIPLGEFDGVTILDREVANSVEKFEKADNALDSYTTSATVTIGELFKAANIDDRKLTIKGDKVQVTVSPVGDDSTAGGTYIASTTENWEDGTLTFSGKGEAEITITDYYFCKPTKITVNVEDVEKFATKFTGGFLYRVGNASGSAVALDSLFTGTDVVDETVKVTIDNISGNAGGTYTSNTSDWTQGKIQFTGTGVVAVTVSDENSTPYTLNLEVINATNHANTTISRITGNTVLLCDTNINTNGALYLSGAALYGNGFTINATDAAVSGTGSVSENYVVGLVNAHLDNVEIIGKVYTAYGALASNNYNRALVVSKGNSSITNCYLSNTASPIRLMEGNLEVKGTTTKGGNFANIDVRNGNLTLEDVTTINQALGNDKADDGTTVIGLGVVIYYEGVSSATVTIENGIKQFNHISNKDKFTNDYANTFVSTMFSNDNVALQFNADGTKWVNTGILSMSSAIGDDNISDVEKYVERAPSMNIPTVGNVTGYVHTQKPDATSITVTAPEYTTAGQGEIAPSYNFDYTTKNYVAKKDGSNDYCYLDNGKVLISMDSGDTFAWDTNILTATKYGQTLDYTVSMNGTDYTSESIVFNNTGDYTVTYTYTDEYNYKLDADGNIIAYSKTYTKTVPISVAVVEASAKNAIFTFKNSTSTEKVTVGNNTYIVPSGVTSNSADWGYITVSGTNIYYPIIEAKVYKSSGKVTAYFDVFGDAVTITDYEDGGTGEDIQYGSSTTSMPDNLSVVKGYYGSYSSANSACLNDSQLAQSGPENTFKYYASSQAGKKPINKSGSLCYQSPSNLNTSGRGQSITIAQYKYVDNAGKTYYYYIGYHMVNAADASSDPDNNTTCLAEGTMITMEDGTKCAVENLRKGDSVMAFDHLTGKVTANDVIIVIKTASDFYENVFVFDDGTKLATINEHGVYDLDLNKYVNITRENADEFIGHRFVSIDDKGNIGIKKLVKVTSEFKSGYKYDIVTESTLNYVAEDTLSVTHVLVDVINSFDFDGNMLYNKAKMQSDIEKYGLYTYDEWEEYCDISVFEEYNIPIMKVGISKGLYTKDYIIGLINTYVLDESVQII